MLVFLPLAQQMIQRRALTAVIGTRISLVAAARATRTALIDDTLMGYHTSVLAKKKCPHCEPVNPLRNTPRLKRNIFAPPPAGFLVPVSPATVGMVRIWIAAPPDVTLVRLAWYRPSTVLLEYLRTLRGVLVRVV